MENNNDPNSPEGGPNISGQSNNFRKSGTKQVQHPDFIGQRNSSHKNQPPNVVGANIRVYTSDIQPKPG